jgi:hypothetical protein
MVLSADDTNTLIVHKNDDALQQKILYVMKASEILFLKKVSIISIKKQSQCSFFLINLDFPTNYKQFLITMK